MAEITFPNQAEQIDQSGNRDLAGCATGHFQIPVLPTSGLDFFGVVAAVNQALRIYPYFVVLRGLPAGGDHRAIEALIRALSGLAPSEPMSLTPVRIDPVEFANATLGTRYSRTHEALASHTDSTFLDKPHSLVAFQMVRSDEAGGGRSTIVPAADLVSRLGDDTTRRLRQTEFPFSKERCLPILWDSQGSISVRYYRKQLNSMIAGRNAWGSCLPLLDMLDQHLADLASQREFALADGEVLIFNNQKVLHGRTAMSPQSSRLLYRFRAHLSECQSTRAGLRPPPGPPRGC